MVGIAGNDVACHCVLCGAAPTNHKLTCRAQRVELERHTLRRVRSSGIRWWSEKAAVCVDNDGVLRVVFTIDAKMCLPNAIRIGFCEIGTVTKNVW